MFKKILIPLDGSLESESSLPYARLLAAKCGAELELFRSFEPLPKLYGLAELEELAAGVLSEARLEQLVEFYLEEKKTELDDIACRTATGCGHPADQILERATDSDLVVMCRHGRAGAGRWLIGGTTAKVARGCLKPVLVVPQGSPDGQAQIQTIMVCLDGSSASTRALEAAASLARQVDARVKLYRAVPLMGAPCPPGDLIDAQSEMERSAEAYPDLVDAILVQPTAVSDHIVDCAREMQADLVVLGSHGRRGFARWLLGSVAEHTLGHVTAPLLIVH